MSVSKMKAQHVYERFDRQNREAARIILENRNQHTGIAIEWAELVLGKPIVIARQSAELGRDPGEGNTL